MKTYKITCGACAFYVEAKSMIEALNRYFEFDKGQEFPREREPDSIEQTYGVVVLK